MYQQTMKVRHAEKRLKRCRDREARAAMDAKAAREYLEKGGGNHAN